LTVKMDLKTILVLFSVLVLATVGSAYLTSWVFTSRSAEPAASEAGALARAESDDYDPGLVWNAGQFTVNLATPSPSSLPRYIKTNLSFRVNSKAAVNELERRRVQVQDRVITTLRMTQSAQLQEPEGLEMLKQRLLAGVNELLAVRGGQALEVYLSELIIQ
jgi:Flagellar basal body-associated protein